VADGAHASRTPTADSARRLGSSSAKIYPKATSNRQVEVLDPKTQKITMIDLCFNTHHLQFDKTTCCGSAPAAITTSWAGSM
jgi:hypothetical protein